MWNRAWLNVRYKTAHLIMCFLKNTDYGHMINRSQIPYIPKLSQSQIENPVKWMKFLAICWKNGFVTQNRELRIHNDKIWAESTTKKSLKYLTTCSTDLPNWPKYLEFSKISFLWVSVLCAQAHYYNLQIKDTKISKKPNKKSIKIEMF